MPIDSDDLFTYARELQHKFPNHVIALYILEDQPHLFSQLKYLYFKSINEVIDFIETQQNSTTSPPFFDDASSSIIIEERIPNRLHERVHTYIFFDPTKYQIIKSGEYQQVSLSPAISTTPAITPRTVVPIAATTAAAVPIVASQIPQATQVPQVSQVNQLHAVTQVPQVAQVQKPSLIDNIIKSIFSPKDTTHIGPVAPPASLVESDINNLTATRGSVSSVNNRYGSNSSNRALVSSVNTRSNSSRTSSLSSPQGSPRSLSRGSSLNTPSGSPRGSPNLSRRNLDFDDY